MGSAWAKNILFYPRELPDEEMRNIPYPTVELYDHVGTKAVQSGAVLGLLGFGPLATLIKKKPLVPTSLRYGRNGMIIGVVLTPVMVQAALKVSKKDQPEHIYDRVYRIRYNRSQVRSAQFCTYIPTATVVIGAFLGPTMFAGAVNGLTVGMAAGTITSAVLPLNTNKKEDKKD